MQEQIARGEKSIGIIRRIHIIYRYDDPFNCPISKATCS